MSISFIILQVSQSYDASRDGVKWSEIRSYNVEAIAPEIAVEQVGLDLPSIGDGHPTLPGVFVQSTNAASMEDNTDRVRATIAYAENTSRNDSKQVQNQFGEVWEWGQTAQRTHITSTTVALGIREWDHFTDPANQKNDVAAESLLIGEKGNGEVEGTDVYRATGTLRVSKEFPRDTINEVLRKSWYAAQARTNDASWKDWAKSEILFIGTNIRISSDVETVDFNFIFGPLNNTTQWKIAFGGSVSGQVDTVPSPAIPVGPHQYVFQQPIERAVDTGGVAGKPNQVEVSARNLKIATVYPETDFDVFGLQGP